MNTVPVSLCICTRHRPEDLRRCLVSAFAGESAPQQVIVSDDGDIGRQVKEIAEQFPGVTYIEGPRRGLAANRNACIRAASAPWIAFVDDDVVLSPDFLSYGNTLAEGHSSSSRVILSGMEWKHTGDSVEHIHPGNADFWGFQRVKPGPEDHRSIVINATLFPASLFREATFDEHLRYGCEEIDIARHAVALGYRILFFPALDVHHYPSPTNRSEYAKLIQASRLYAAGKAHWRYEKSVLKTLLYVVLAPPREVLSNARLLGVKGAKDSLRALRLAFGYALQASRGR